MNDFNSIIEVGFYGKLPTYGDFIQTRLPKDFVNPWHEWLQSGMMACREKTPEGWMSYYLNCPAWRFVLAGGVCGEQAVAGVTIPSVDRVGRYFNFTMASILPVNTIPISFACARSSWLDDLENLAVSALEEEMDQDAIEESINSLPTQLSWDPNTCMTVEIDAQFTKVKSDESSDIHGIVPEMLHNLIARSQNPYGLWWHHGCSQVTPQLLTCGKMPSGELYLGLMMDEESVVSSEVVSQVPEVDYMDELLSD